MVSPAGKGVVRAACALVADTAGSGVGSKEPQHTPPCRIRHQRTSCKHDATGHDRWDQSFCHLRQLPHTAGQGRRGCGWCIGDGYRGQR